MNWPKVAGSSGGSRMAFVLVTVIILGMFVFLVVNFVSSSTTARDERACAFARDRIGDIVVRIGSYRGAHPCNATALDSDDRLWKLEGIYQSGLVREIQPDIPYAGIVVWDDDAETFQACVIDFRRAGEDSTAVETIRPDPQSALCPEQ